MSKVTHIGIFRLKVFSPTASFCHCLIKLSYLIVCSFFQLELNFSNCIGDGHCSCIDFLFHPALCHSGRQSIEPKVEESQKSQNCGHLPDVETGQKSGPVTAKHLTYISKIFSRNLFLACCYIERKRGVLSGKIGVVPSLKLFYCCINLRRLLHNLQQK